MREVLEDMRRQLEKIGPQVYYGQAGALSKDDEWDYVVFFRDRFELNQNKTSGSLYFRVAVVRENYVEENMEWKLMEILSEIPGLRPVPDAEYDYTTKPDTQNVVEVLSISFCLPIKGG